LARKPQYRIYPWLGPDLTSGFSDTRDPDLILAEAVTLSIPPASGLSVPDLLSQFPNLYVAGQQQANFRSGARI